MEKVETRHLAASGVVTRSPSMLMGLNVDADVTQATSIVVYDGHNTSGRKVLTLQSWGTVADQSATGRQTTSNWNSPYGKSCPNGIYITMSTAVDVYVDWVRDGS